MTAQQDPDSMAGGNAPQSPAFQVIAEDLRQKIASGELGAGAQLPTDLELGEQYQASRHTIRNAIESLVSERLVKIIPSGGALVSQTVKPYVTTLGMASTFSEEDAACASEMTVESRRHTASTPRVEIQVAGGLIASELQLAAGSSVVSRHQRCFIEDTPWALKTSFYSMSLVVQGAFQLLQAADISAGVHEHLLEMLGIRRVGMRSMITARLPDETETHFFDLPDDHSVPIIEIGQTEVSDEGRPFILTVVAYPADRNQLIVNVGMLPIVMERGCV